MTRELYLQIEELYVRTVLGHYTPLRLARTLEGMANQAWDEVDEFFCDQQN